MKYEIMDIAKTLADGRTVRRIRALRDIPSINVRIGDLGGWVQSEGNLSQDGDAWIGYEAIAMGESTVIDDALVTWRAIVDGKASVGQSAFVGGDALVSDNAQIKGRSQVYKCARVRGHAIVEDDAQVCGYAAVLGFATISGKAIVAGEAFVEDVAVGWDAWIVGNAVIYQLEDYTCLRNFWSSYRTITYTHSNRMYKVGCFHGSGKELVRQAYADSPYKGDCYRALVEMVENIERMRKKRERPKRKSVGKLKHGKQ